MLGKWRLLRRVVLAVIVMMAAAEACSRLDDWIFLDVPFCANPDREHDLTVHDEHGVHGRPNGHFRKWHLNAFGFRGPQIEERPAPGSMRILILGASETFGLYESANQEYPAQLAEDLRREDRRVEVINAAMAGISVKSMLPYWENWAARVQPQIVLIYPAPMFYLDDEPPQPPRGDTADQAPGLTRAAVSRGGSGIPCVATEWLRSVRREWLLWRDRDRQDPDWVFRVRAPGSARPVSRRPRWPSSGPFGRKGRSPSW